MTSKNYTNLILTVIAVLLIGILSNVFLRSPLENKVLAGDEKYKEFRTVSTYVTDSDRAIQENVKVGWKPISIAQSQKVDDSTPNITILFAK